MTRKHKRAVWLRSIAGGAALSGSLLVATHASAEVTIAKGESWDVYVAGRVGAFLSYANGQGYPVPKQPGSMIQPGGGVDASDPPRDTIRNYDAMGMPITTEQGKLSKMRLRSGMFPNILTFGVHKTFGPDLKLTGQLSIWGTIESDDTLSAGKQALTPANGIRDNGVTADFKEGFLRAEGSWGQVDGGRFLSLHGRGMTEMDVKYGHGYGVGFPMVIRSLSLPLTGDLTFPGPTSGMTGFGVLSGTYAAGIAYTTPNLSGLHFAFGLFDPIKYAAAGWGTTRGVRPEAEVTYDLNTSGVLLHVFGSGGFQGLHVGGTNDSANIWGATYGARIEFGPIHLGGGGFLGKGAGVDYAFDVNPAVGSDSSMHSVSITNPDGTKGTMMLPSHEMRNQRGFVGMVQVVLGPVDLNAAVGQTQVLLLDADKAAASMISVLKTQTGISGAVVYHMNENLHLDLDFINGGYRWYGGESQSLNVVNAGATVTF